MKIGLADPRQRGLAMGLNEFAGYSAVAGAALAKGYVASRSGLRPVSFYLGVAFVLLGLPISAVLVRETRHHGDHEASTHGDADSTHPGQREIFIRTTFTNPNLSSVNQAGLVNNLNDGMARGLFPLFFAGAGMNLGQISWLAGGHLSGRLGHGSTVYRCPVGPGRP